MIIRYAILTTILAGLLLNLPIAASALGQEQPTSLEYKVKAGFILNFAKFMNWPKTAFESNNIPFRIGIIGTNPFNGALQDAENKKVHGKSVDFIEIKNIKQAKQCHLVFVSLSQKEMITDILDTLQGEPVVVVSDIENFAASGGTIEFITLNGRLAFIINNTRAKQSGVEIPANLLNLASAIL